MSTMRVKIGLIAAALKAMAFATTATSEPVFSTIERQEGRGLINGVEMPITVATGVAATFADKLRLELAKTRTVTVESGPFGKVLIAADIKSAQCPQCALPSPETIEARLAEAQVFSIFEVAPGKNLALGMPLGQLSASGALTKKKPYQGQLLGAALKGGQALFQVELSFSGQQVRFAVVQSPVPDTQLVRAINTQMLKSGFKPFGLADADISPDAKDEQVVAWSAGQPASSAATGRTIWQRGDRLVTISVMPSRDQQNQTTVEIYENSSRP